MIKIKLNLDKKGIHEKVALSQNVVRCLESNPYFYNQNLNTKGLESVIVQIQKSKLHSHNPDEQLKLLELEIKLDNEIEAVANSVQKISRGNSIIISSTGLEWERPNENIISLCGLNASVKKEMGEADIKWQRVYGAKAYLIEMSTNPDNPNSWKKIGHSIRSQYTCFNLKKDQPYYIKVSVLGADKKVITSSIKRFIAA